MIFFLNIHFLNTHVGLIRQICIIWKGKTTKKKFERIWKKIVQVKWCSMLKSYKKLKIKYGLRKKKILNEKKKVRLTLKFKTEILRLN